MAEWLADQSGISRILAALILFLPMLSNGQTRSPYEVHRIPAGKMTLTGRGDHPLWRKAGSLTDFIYPWNEGRPPAMSFQAVHDKDWLYGLFRVHDPKKILVYRDKDSKLETLRSDRVEIFFRQDARMDPYYGLEMDAEGRVYDFQTSFPNKSNPAWFWPAGHLKIASAYTPDGYTLEFAVSKKSLKELGLLNKNKIEAGLYRGECINLVDGKAEFKWISWVRPDTETPQFHTPSSFGLLMLR
jgi:hypothetical protein